MTNNLQATPHFKMSEFACKPPSGGPVPDALVDAVRVLAEQLEVIRAHFGAPVHVVSGWRSAAHNAVVDGAGHSQHMLGHAADIRVDGFTPRQVCDGVKSLIASGSIMQGGVGLYTSAGTNWVHYDTRGTAARWGGA